LKVYLITLACDLLQEIWDALALGAVEAAALEEGHDVLAWPVENYGPLCHQQDIIEEVVGLWLGLEQRSQNCPLRGSKHVSFVVVDGGKSSSVGDIFPEGARGRRVRGGQGETLRYQTK
jgi:hypothetical protein